MKCFAGCKHAPPLIVRPSVRPSVRPKSLAYYNSFELERAAREPRARSASSVVGGERAARAVGRGRARSASSVQECERAARAALCDTGRKSLLPDLMRLLLLVRAKEVQCHRNILLLLI